MKNKFNLNQLKVKSFVTDLNKDTRKTIAGGGPLHDHGGGLTGHHHICPDHRWSVEYGDCTGGTCHHG